MTTDVISQHKKKSLSGTLSSGGLHSLFISLALFVGSSDFLIPYRGRGFGNVEDGFFFSVGEMPGASWEDDLNCEEQQRRKYDLELCAIDFLMQLTVSICRNMVTSWVVFDNLLGIPEKPQKTWSRVFVVISLACAMHLVRFPFWSMRNSTPP